MPDTFSKHTIALFGEEGKVWLDQIPSIVSHYEALWNCKAADPFILNYNYVIPVILADNTTAVLKLACPGNKEFLTEIAALKIFNGEGIVKVIKEDIENYAVLLEHITPGEQLINVQQEDDTKATSIAVSVMKNLWKPLSSNYIFPTIADWGKAFAEYKEKFSNQGVLPEDLVEKAETIFTELLASSSNPVLLHGDLHYENILSSKSSGWVAIDPKGLVGEPAYEAGVLLRNPYPYLIKETDAKKILEKRLNQLSEELYIDKKRLWGWGFSQAVLSAIWVVENRKQYVEYYLSCANLLNSLENNLETLLAPLNPPTQVL